MSNALRKDLDDSTADGPHRADNPTKDSESGETGNASAKAFRVGSEVVMKNSAALHQAFVAPAAVKLQGEDIQEAKTALQARVELAGKTGRVTSTKVADDYSSIYLAVITKTDPTPVIPINFIKKKLNNSF